jgi:hypothetical protein
MTDGNKLIPLLGILPPLINKELQGLYNTAGICVNLMQGLTRIMCFTVSSMLRRLPNPVIMNLRRAQDRLLLRMNGIGFVAGLSNLGRAGS